jgi:hypothetical protein
MDSAVQVKARNCTGSQEILDTSRRDEDTTHDNRKEIEDIRLNARGSADSSNHKDVALRIIRGGNEVCHLLPMIPLL